jgi:hypothetical protein
VIFELRGVGGLQGFLDFISLLGGLGIVSPQVAVRLHKNVLFTSQGSLQK